MRCYVFIPVCCILAYLLLQSACGAPVVTNGGKKPCQTDADCLAEGPCAAGVCVNSSGGGERTSGEGVAADNPTGDGTGVDAPSGDASPSENPVTTDTTTTDRQTPGPCATGDIRSCYEGPSGTANVGRCREGRQECVNGQWGACQRQRTPETEQCNNGEDEDCDGQIDEGCNCRPGEEQNCGKDEGACREGKQLCQSDGTWGTCQGAVGPTAEICGDGRDNDCDGQTDEGCPCTPGQTRNCGSDRGECTEGRQLCQNDSTWSACQGGVGPTTEICGDGKDNDCDGQTDEGCPCTPGQTRRCGQTDQGECQRGRQLCQNDGSWSPCQGEVTPTTEVCGDGKDNDCDGQIDEGCSQPSGFCASCQQDSECVTQTGRTGKCLSDPQTTTKACFITCQTTNDCPTGFVCQTHPQGGNTLLCTPPLRGTNNQQSEWLWGCLHYRSIGQRCQNRDSCGGRLGDKQGADCGDGNRCTVYCRRDSDCPQAGYECDGERCKRP